jgi:hypothetical protein
MNVNKVRFASVTWIVVTCTETIANAVGFTFQLYNLSGKALFNCAVLINIYRTKKDGKTHKQPRITNNTQKC